ncbi:uncharacterized protein LOC131626615 [Vicia villosa]|uniref:uncharacterized protein LOC131626615 n=1 Tax=Vicia villosa TaxID=3911 RepID=UPI00273CDA0D|nr:uncharacterized protein LOC131626615 [Vicia villosa]
MSRPIEPLKEINDSKDLWKIVVRCKHLWTVTSSSNKEHMEMVLVDSKLDMIQAIVPAYLLSKFKSEIETGNSYIMQNFKVGKNDFAFKSTSHTYKLVFCGSTSVKKAEFPDISHNYLNIIGLNSIVEGRFQSNLLVDLIGGITDITQTQVNVQLYEYYKNNKQASDIVIVLINARVKEAQGGFPFSVSNTWNGTKLLINDPTIEEVKSLKERLGVDLPLLSSSSVQVEATQNSFYSDYDKFVWKAEIMSLSEITNLQHETTCVTVATLDKFDVWQMGWYYDGCVECTRSVTAKDGKLKCFKKHISPEPVPRYKLDITAVDGSSKAKFFFWDTDCVKLIGKSALQMKMDLTQTSKLRALEPLSQDDMNSISEPVSASAENNLTIENSGLTPCKRLINDAIEDNDSVQQSSTKMARDIKKEKYYEKLYRVLGETLQQDCNSFWKTISVIVKYMLADPWDCVLQIRFLSQKFFKGDFSKLSNSSVQVTASKKSYYSDFDKFETTCVTVATLCKFHVGKAGWYYDPTSRLRIMEPSSPDDFPSVSEPLSVSADYDPSISNTKLKPAKGILSDAVEEIEGVQLSSTKLIKDIKKE